MWCRAQAQQNPPAVLVDGYNVLMLWLREPGDLERKARVAGSLEAAREELLRDLSDFSGFKRFRIMVAFDAHGNPLAPALSRCRPVSKSWGLQLLHRAACYCSQRGIDSGVLGCIPVPGAPASRRSTSRFSRIALILPKW